MSAGRPPIETVGEVAIYEKGKKGYYRLKWPEPDGTEGDTSGGTALDYARAKAGQINDRISMAAGPRATGHLHEIVQEFLVAGHSPYKGKKPWKPANAKIVRDAIHRCLRAISDERAMDLDRRLCDRMRAHGATEQMVKQNTGALRAFLHWGEQNGYFTGFQAELLPRACSMPAPTITRTMTWIGGVQPADRVRMNGQDEAYVRDEDAPSRARVVALSQALAALIPLWGHLAPEFAANTGARWGEQFQLTAHDVHVDGCAEYADAHAHVDWQVNAGDAGPSANGRRVRPKGDKTRVIPIPTLSFTGYRLRDAVRERAQAALTEQAAGTNPEALMFPATLGAICWYSSFNADFLLPAMEQAGWPVEIWSEETQRWDEGARAYRPVRFERRKAGLPWHSLRHRFARICVDVKHMPEGELMAIGGWENISTVQTRYYRSGRENMERGLSHFD